MFSHFFTLRNRVSVVRTNGFGLIELLVSISIIVIVVSVILVRQESFNSAVLLRSEAYEVALQIREVQLNAVSVVFDDEEFRSPLGVHFDITEPGRYRIFRDDGDGYYESGEEFGKQGILDRRFEIKAVRPGPTSIVFERPDFDAQFYLASNQLRNTNEVEIVIGRKGETGGGTRTVVVTAAGQISVQ